ncbi:MAG: hypothetical protein HY684_04465 [Chloroflexi bacterium]|nr:hypothetical protein [Chloroflexota bacterium]
MKRLKLAVVAFLAALLAFSTVGSAYAAPTEQATDVQRRAVVGVVKAIDGNTVTVQTRSGDEVKVTIASDTRIRVPGKPTAALSDVAVGARVAVVAQVKDSLLTALSVVVNPVQAARRDMLERLQRASVVRSAQALVRSLQRELARASDDVKPVLQQALDAALKAQAAAQDALKKLPPIVTPLRGALRGTITDVNTANSTITIQASRAALTRGRPGGKMAPRSWGRPGGRTMPGARARQAGVPITLTVTDNTQVTRNAHQQAKLSDLKLGDLVVVAVYDRDNSEALRIQAASQEFWAQLQGARAGSQRFWRGFGPRLGPRPAPSVPPSQ